jgi:site-specific recombinase XerD
LYLKKGYKPYVNLSPLFEQLNGGIFVRKRVVNIQIESTRDDLVNEFLEKKKVQGQAPETVYQHLWLLRVFFRDYYSGDIKECKELNKAIQAFLTGKRDVYYNQSLRTLRLFFDYCVEEGVLAENPCKKQGYKYRKDKPRIIQHTSEAIATILKQPNRSTFRGLRDYSLMLLMLDTGIRPGEALRLRLTDFEGKTIHVRKEIAKTRVERYLPISNAVNIMIQKLLKVRHTTWDNKDGILFCGFHGKEISTAALHRSWKKYAVSSGIEFFPYCFRHQFALSWVRNGGGAFELQKIMGHTRLDMTLTYVHLASTDVEEAHQKFSPLQSFLNPVEKRITKIKR